jgi:hypothetical protein
VVIGRKNLSKYNILLENRCKQMHAETPRLADKTIVFFEHVVFKVVGMVT